MHFQSWGLQPLPTLLCYISQQVCSNNTPICWLYKQAGFVVVFVFVTGSITYVEPRTNQKRATEQSLTD